MKICRFRATPESWGWGEISGESVRELRLSAADPVVFSRTDTLHSLKDLDILTPVLPTQLIGIGDNFPRSESDQLHPVIFNKSISSLVANGSIVTLPAGYNTWGESEIGVVIKKSCFQLRDFKPSDYILGFCLINDTTALSSSHVHDSHSPEAKGQKGFCQMGSFINTDFEYEEAMIEGYVNGNLYRKGAAARMKWDLRKILVEVSARHSLKPFDVIFTGCPERVSREKTYLSDGDEFVVRVEGLGSLVTKYRKEL